MRVLIACEESQTVCKAFRAKGHEAYSCDIQGCSGGHPEWHIQCDALGILNPGFNLVPDTYEEITGIYFRTMDDKLHFVKRWDLIIAHPPCTFLTVTGNRWFDIERYGEAAINRLKDRERSIELFMSFVDADCDRIAIENPVGIMSTRYRKPDQIVHPYMFGDAFEKRTCLWLKGLCLLSPSNVVTPPERKRFKSGNTMPSWYADLWSFPKDERCRLRSKTFPGIADAMANQWG